ncbi:MAG: DUF6273 domain-containing protein [Defluviitaleaceae bacterium]|nr:DUF6273 domain-containing protein [Defluviitaleaceae bacterium]
MKQAGLNYETMLFGGQEWLVLEKQQDKALLLRKFVIQQNDFNLADYYYSELRWENNPLRLWLNNEYYSSFYASDKQRIISTSLENAPNPWYNVDGGNDTEDSIFLLSLWDVVNYFGDSGLLAKGDPNGLFSKGKIKDQYNLARMALDETGKAQDWFLRTIGWEIGPRLPINSFVGVSNKGILLVYGYGPSVYAQLRPAMWIKI